MIEIEEGIEALDAAIEYKNEAISSAREHIRRSASISKVHVHFNRKPRHADTPLTKFLDTLQTVQMLTYLLGYIYKEEFLSMYIVIKIKIVM